MTNNKLQKLIQEIVKEVLSEAKPPPVPPQALRQAPPQQPAQAPQGDPNQAFQRPIPRPPPKAFGLNQTSGPVTPPIAQALLKMYAKQLAEKKGVNIDNLQQLGVGTQGVAYSMGDKVLKITGDVREAKAAGVLAGQELPNVIKFYDAWQFPNTEFFGVVMEQITPLSDQEKKELNTSIIELGPKSKEEAEAAGINPKLVGVGFPGLILSANDSFREAQKLLAKILAKRYYDKPDAEKLKAATSEQFKKLITDYKMQNLFGSLKKLGIQYYDFHAGNYGRRQDGTLVLLDLGNGKVKGGTPPMLEELMNKLTLATL